jgi:hypothetical protein
LVKAIPRVPTLVNATREGISILVYFGSIVKGLRRSHLKVSVGHIRGSPYVTFEGISTSHLRASVGHI